MTGAINVILLHQENVMIKITKLQKRLVQLENNEFIKPLLDDCNDPVLADIHDIPRICANIQEDWQDVGLNRMTAWHLGQCIKKRMQGHVDGTVENIVTIYLHSVTLARAMSQIYRSTYLRLSVIGQYNY